MVCETKPISGFGGWGEWVVAGAVAGSWRETCCAACRSTAEAGPEGLGVVCETNPISGFSVSGESVTEESTPDCCRRRARRRASSPRWLKKGWHGVDAVLEGEAGAVADAVAAAIGLDLCLRCHRASASSTVAGEPARFRGVG